MIKDVMQPDKTHAQSDINFHGAAILDEHGHEILITEAMIQNACQCMEECWHFPRCCEEALPDAEHATLEFSDSATA